MGRVCVIARHNVECDDLFEVVVEHQRDCDPCRFTGFVGEKGEIFGTDACCEVTGATLEFAFPGDDVEQVCGDNI